ncbi:unnamed protein product [Trifolium pratense]|uniref:Uncharacterized protein n=1 Tax=Trifolium pratense TaxID=57577 RepID=A0ACB0IA90_TRIPR|nr:unnamed protein product [Trifolium pratense]
MEYLKLLGSEELSTELVILKDRIALSTEPEEDLKTTAFENSQSHGGSFYGADNSNYNMNYYQPTNLL